MTDQRTSSKAHSPWDLLLKRALTQEDSVALAVPDALAEVDVVVLSLSLSIEVTARELTPAERDVATCILQELSHDAVARARRTSTRTVAKQVARVFRKLCVGSRAELCARMRAGPEPAPAAKRRSLVR